MAKKLSEWCKAVKIEMIKRDWSVGDLAEAVFMTREYVSAIINGRVYSAPAVKTISDVLMLRPIFYDLQLPGLIVADLPDIMT